MDIQLIYGSDTGNTENFIDTVLLNELEANGFKVKPIPVDVVTSDTWKDNSNFILGIPTWYDGELQSSWEDYFGMFQEIDFTDKTVAIFGLIHVLIGTESHQTAMHQQFLQFCAH